ncbi:MAG: hypothetical protein LBS10_08235 [Gracilibacteraceae bacterium]|jgi:mannose-6-phosphate isomerase-like protein (cupin superfamily)|nr:hypothetical protein [Gracilibacteraceae bacterium]
MYEIIDVNNSLNLRTLQYDKESRLRTAPGFDGDPVDNGHNTHWVWRTEHLGLIMASQQAGMKTSPKGGFVLHNNAVEMEYLLEGECDLSYPGDRHILFRIGDCLCHQPSQPHCMEAITPHRLYIAVMISCAPGNCDRTEYRGEASIKAVDSWQVKTCAEVLPQLEDDGNVEVRGIYENNEHPISLKVITLKPGGSYPAKGFYVSNVDEYYYVTGGQGVATYPEKAYDLRKQVTTYNYAGQAFKYVNTGAEDMVILNVAAATKYSDVKYDIVEIPVVSGELPASIARA